MLEFDGERARVVGAAGRLEVPDGDEVTRKLAMLVEGCCEGLGATRAARKYGYSRSRYYQLLAAFRTGGAVALKNGKRGPKTHYRRTHEVVRQVIRHRFLDPGASADVIAQKLRQCGRPISTRSVERVVEDYGLQKTTPSLPPGPPAGLP
jgi:transposase